MRRGAQFKCVKCVKFYKVAVLEDGATSERPFTLGWVLGTGAAVVAVLLPARLHSLLFPLPP